MAKSRARNKQAELLEKMAAAKSAKGEEAPQLVETLTSDDNKPIVVGDATPTSVDQQEQRAVFAQLLNTTQRAIPRRDSEEEDFGENAFFPDIKVGKVKQPVPQPRPSNKPQSSTPSSKLVAHNNSSETVVVVAERVHFESLLNITTEQPIGAMTAARLVPWVPPYWIDSLVVLTDPRRHSRDLRVALQYLAQPMEHKNNNRLGSSRRTTERQMNQNSNETTTDAKKAHHHKTSKRRVQVIGITADAPQQARGWVKSGGLSDIQVLSDPHLEWMMAYRVIGGGDSVLPDAVLLEQQQQQHDNSNEWSLTLIEFDTDGSVRRFLRNVDPAHVLSLVEDD